VILVEIPITYFVVLGQLQYLLHVIRYSGRRSSFQEAGDWKTPHLLVDLHSSLKLKGKELILQLRRKLVRKSLKVQGEKGKQANKHLLALSNKRKRGSMAWRYPSLHNKARGHLTSNPLLWKSSLKMNC